MGPDLVPQMSTSSTDQSEDESCPVCMDGWRGKTTFECGHSMCTACFAKFVGPNKVCHVCRAPVPGSAGHARPERLPNLTDINRKCLEHVLGSTDHMLEFVEHLRLDQDPNRWLIRVKGLFDSQFRLGMVAGLTLAYDR